MILSLHHLTLSSSVLFLFNWTEREESLNTLTFENIIHFSLNKNLEKTFSV